MYLLSAMLMFASPFFTSGRAAILPYIATKEELHTANTMTQTTSWASLTIGAFLGAVGVSSGFQLAFVYNALSFVISFLCIWQLRRPGGFRAEGGRRAKHEKTGFAQYREGLGYMRATPLVAGVAMISLGWASGGGAAQILFSLFGEKVFNAGAMGIGIIWGFAGVGLLIGAGIAYWLGKRLTFSGYKRTIPIVYVIHGGAYVVFSQMPTLAWACVFIALSRAAVAVSSVLNYTQLLHHVEDRFRGRVFATLESLTWSMMMVSMMAAGTASIHYSPRTIGACAGVISSTTAFFWWWADWRGKFPEPPEQTVSPGADQEVIAEPPLAHRSLRFMDGKVSSRNGRGKTDRTLHRAGPCGGRRKGRNPLRLIRSGSAREPLRNAETRRSFRPIWKALKKSGRCMIASAGISDGWMVWSIMPPGSRSLIHWISKRRTGISFTASI